MPVALFVNAEDALVDAAIAAIPQLLAAVHGDESPQACAAPGARSCAPRAIAAGFDLLDFATRFAHAQAILLDAHVDGYGGGGKVFDWSLVRADVPFRSFCLVGLHAANVALGIQQLRPWAVDVSPAWSPRKASRMPTRSAGSAMAVREADARSAASIA